MAEHKTVDALSTRLFTLRYVGRGPLIYVVCRELINGVDARSPTVFSSAHDHTTAWHHARFRRTIITKSNVAHRTHIMLSAPREEEPKFSRNPSGTSRSQTPPRRVSAKATQAQHVPRGALIDESVAVGVQVVEHIAIGRLLLALARRHFFFSHFFLPQQSFAAENSSFDATDELWLNAQPHDIAHSHDMLVTSLEFRERFSWAHDPNISNLGDQRNGAQEILKLE